MKTIQTDPTHPDFPPTENQASGMRQAIEAAQVFSDLSQREALHPSATGDRARGVAHLQTRLREVASGNLKRLTVLQIGDSLALRAARYIGRDHLSQWYLDPDNVIVQDDAAGRSSTGVGGTEGVINLTGTATDFSKDNYSFNWVGSYIQIQSGEYAHLTRLNTPTPVDRILIPYYINTNGGSFRIKLTSDSAAIPTGQQNNSAWVNVSAGDIASSHTLTGSELIIDTNGAEGLGVVVLEFSSLSNYAIQCFHTGGGTVNLLHPMFEANSIDCVNYYGLAESSNDFNSINTVADSKMAAFISELKPDIVTIQCNDDANAADAIMDSVKAALDGSTLNYTPLVIPFGNGPVVNDEPTMVQQNEAFAKKAVEYNYGFFSFLDVCPTIAELTLLGWEADGVHLAQEFYQECINRVAIKYGFSGPRGASYDPAGYKAYLASPKWHYDFKDAPMANTNVVGSGSQTGSTFWRFITGTTANSKLTRYVNQFGGPLHFRDESYEFNFDKPFSITFAAKVNTANAEGSFWIHFGQTPFNGEGAIDPSVKDISFKLANATPTLQVHDGATLAEVTGTAIDHHTEGTTASETWITYRIINATGGRVFLFQNNTLVAQTDNGPTGTLVGAGFKIAVSNGATAADYQVWVTPPVFREL